MAVVAEVEQRRQARPGGGDPVQRPGMGQRTGQLQLHPQLARSPPQPGGELRRGDPTHHHQAGPGSRRRLQGEEGAAGDGDVAQIGEEGRVRLRLRGGQRERQVVGDHRMVAAEQGGISGLGQGDGQHPLRPMQHPARQPRQRPAQGGDPAGPGEQLLGEVLVEVEHHRTPEEGPNHPGQEQLGIVDRHQVPAPGDQEEGGSQQAAPAAPGEIDGVEAGAVGGAGGGRGVGDLPLPRQGGDQLGPYARIIGAMDGRDHQQTGPCHRGMTLGASIPVRRNTPRVSNTSPT